MTQEKYEKAKQIQEEINQILKFQDATTIKAESEEYVTFKFGLSTLPDTQFAPRCLYQAFLDAAQAHRIKLEQEFKEL